MERRCRAVAVGRIVFLTGLGDSKLGSAKSTTEEGRATGFCLGSQGSQGCMPRPLVAWLTGIARSGTGDGWCPRQMTSLERGFATEADEFSLHVS